MSVIRDCAKGALLCCVILAHPGHAEITLTLATGDPTGVYYPLGNAIKKIVEEEHPDINVEVLATKGSAENAQLLQDEDADLAFVQNDTAYYFRKGQRMFALPSDRMRGIASLYTEYIQIVAMSGRNLRQIKQLREKRVRTAAKRETVNCHATDILKAAGFRSSDVEDVNLPFKESFKALRNGSIDAAFVTAGIPTPGIQELGNEIRIIPIDLALARKLQRSCPYFVRRSIPAKAYSWQEEEIETVGVRALLVARTGLPSEWVGIVAAAIFKHTDTLAKVHKAARGIHTDSILDGMTVPLHEGAETYFGGHVTKLKVLSRVRDWAAIGVCIALLVCVLRCRKAISRSVRKTIFRHVAVILVCLYAIAAIAMFFAERGRTEGFETLPSAFWSTTVYILSGFAERAPITWPGRITSASIVGLGAVVTAMITGLFAAMFVRREDIRMPRNIAEHLAICNWNERGDRVIQELHSAQGEPDTHIVIVTGTSVDEKALRRDNRAYENVFFIKSDPVLHNTLKASKVHLAKSVVILADDASPDPDARSAMIALAISRLCETEETPKPHIVAEVINHRMMQHLKDAHVDEIVCATDFGLGILAQCALQEKLSIVYNDLLRYTRDTNEIYMLKSGQYPSSFIGKTFQECAAIINEERSPDNPVILIGVRRENRVILNPRTKQKAKAGLFEELQEDDMLIVMAYRKPDLSRLKKG
ncbi:MAG: TAXI family TRAP transporter solute-binding subunit [Phycisphaerales bacterium]|nr:MAG: TAXI family TRAP transporter solute-binding subunit [Phycisphaerales bacterium]